MSVHEDPDDVGYWFDVDPPEFDFPKFDSLAPNAEACELLVPDWPAIAEAAICAHQGIADEAEAARVKGGYGGLQGVDPGTWTYPSMQ